MLTFVRALPLQVPMLGNTHWTTLQEAHHTPAEETSRISHLEKISILGLGKYTEVDSCDVLVSRIHNRTTILHKLEAIEFLERLLSKLVSYLFLSPFTLLFNI